MKRVSWSTYFVLRGIYHLALPLPMILICSLFIVGGGELYTWGSNENGCLGTGYGKNIFFVSEIELSICYSHLLHLFIIS